MKGHAHRVAVYFGLRSDLAAASEARRDQRRWPARLWNLALQVLLFNAGAILAISVFVFIGRIVFGGDLGLRDVLEDSAEFWGAILFIALLVFWVGRWVLWFAKRWAH